MKFQAITVEGYLAEVPHDRKQAFNKMRETILANIPEGFSEGMAYGMIGYCVPHSIYPAGYHCDPKLPLPFASIASQKNFIALYHSGIYADEELKKWFVMEYSKFSTTKLDMGKSCIRFKKPDQIPFDLIGQLMRKITVQDWIEIYERNLKR